MAWREGRLAGHAFTFERPVQIGGVETPVMALAQVCVEPASRGNGLGARLVRQAFQRLQSERFPLSIFQTTVPAFYEKLGARVVDSRFVDSRNLADPGARPWKDGAIMIYPLDYNWPDGPIDLNGPGY
jgi:predicted N-acetyltransferase YhbS